MGSTVNVRLDEESEAALNLLKASGRNNTDAVRFALVSAAANETAASWEGRARELASDSDDLAEVAEVRELMDSLRPGAL